MINMLPFFFGPQIVSDIYFNELGESSPKSNIRLLTGCQAGVVCGILILVP